MVFNDADKILIFKKIISLEGLQCEAVEDRISGKESY